MFDRKRRWLIVAIAISVALAGCAPSVPAVVKAAEVSSNKPRVDPTSADESAIPSLVEGNTRLALDLYRTLFNAGENQFASPYSISLALAMTYAGARNETAAEMARTLHWMSVDDLPAAFNALDLLLRSRGQDLTKDERFRLNIANAIWGQQGFGFQDEFLDTLAQYYNSGLRLLDFSHSPDAARKVINQWVEEQTEDKIKDLLPEGSIDSLVRMVLTNAIYFNAAWQYPFDQQATHDGVFHRLDGSTVTVPLMHQSELLGYAAGPGYQAVELPYVGGELSMLILLPDEGTFADWAKKLDADTLAGIVGSLEHQQVQLSLPRFSFDSEVQLKAALQKLGMSQPFTAEADFSGMTGRRDLFIDDVYHKAFVAVDESGTEAAAATAVVIRLSGMPLEPVAVTVDRPFLFLIRDTGTGAVLFLGHVVNPAQS